MNTIDRLDRYYTIIYYHILLYQYIYIYTYTYIYMNIISIYYYHILS